MAKAAQQVEAKGETTAPGGFVHLHLHTEYSLLDGGNRIDRLMDRVKELGMHAVACTDHGNLFGAVAFYLGAKERGLKAILGVEAYVAPGPRTDRTFTGVSDGGYHLVLLAMNETGWRNLLYLCSEAYLTGFYFKPRMDRELLEKHGEGLIAINGHLGSEIGEHLLEYDRTREDVYFEKAMESARWHHRVFGDRFYLELQHHVEDQNRVNPHIIKMAHELKIPLVADNDAHFLRAEDHDAHDTLVCISTAKGKNDDQRMKYPTQIYVKSPAEMDEAFESYGEIGREALANSAKIADRCDLKLPLGQNHAPMVRIALPETKTLPKPGDAKFGGDLSAWYVAYCSRFELRPFTTVPTAAEIAESKKECDKALWMLAEAGYIWRYGVEADKGDQTKSDERRARLERELKILCDKGIAAYFLIVWDFVNWGRQNGVPALARGSGVGTMVGYVLGLSNACPVRYGLLFERFTDPDRSEYPDIDIDLCQDGRARVIDYVRRKYGHVAQIITFGTLKAKAAVRDVGRVLEMPLAEVDKVAKLIPETLGMTLERALEQEPDLKSLYDRDPLVQRCIDNAKALEGQARHASVHAAGVIVATRPLHEIVPLYKSPSAAGTEVVTQWDGPTCEKMGLLKMDFLGLRTISVVERAKRLIREGLDDAAIFEAVGRTKGDARPHPLDLDRLTFDDQTVFEMFRRGDTTGVFQFESPGMRRLLVDMKPDRLEDLIAANALFRPGPMDLIPDYNRRKHGTERVPKVHPIVDQYTAETYGVMVYQEQVMQIVHGLGGIPLRAAYSLIKSISKKQQKKIDAERPRFIEGAGKQGLNKSSAEELFELILKFAGYGFNKSHSTGYAIVAYQTAYLKTFFPNQYMAAFLTYESGAMQAADWTPYLEDCKKTRFIDPTTGKVIKTGVEVRPPDLNLSESDFSVVFEPGEPHAARNGHVRFGLKAIKGVGEKAIESIIKERQKEAGAPVFFTSLFDFCERVSIGGAGGNSGSVNKATIEALIKAGALDCLHTRKFRAAMVASIDAAVNAGSSLQRDKAAGQSSLFGGGPSSPAAPRAGAALAKVEPWTETETLQGEKEALGFYLSSHPLDQHAALIGRLGNATTKGIREKRFPQDTRVVVGACVQAVRNIMIKSGKNAGGKMGVVALEDREGSIESVAFTEVYAKFGPLLKVDSIIFVVGKVDLQRGDPQIIIEQVIPLERAAAVLTKRIRLIVDEHGLNGGAEVAMQKARAILQGAISGGNGNGNGNGHAGASDAPSGPGAPAMSRAAEPTMVGIELVVRTNAGEALLDAGRVKLGIDSGLVMSLTSVLGKESVALLGPGLEKAKSEPKPWERRSGG